MLQTIKVGNLSADNFSPQTILSALAGAVPKGYGVVDEGSLDSLVSTSALRPPLIRIAPHSRGSGPERPCMYFLNKSLRLFSLLLTSRPPAPPQS